MKASDFNSLFNKNLSAPKLDPVGVATVGVMQPGAINNFPLNKVPAGSGPIVQETLIAEAGNVAPQGFIDTNAVGVEQIIPGAVPSVNQVIDGGFEDDPDANWTGDYRGDEVGGTYQKTSDARTGLWAYQITGANGSSKADIAGKPFPVIAGDTYYVSAWVKSDVPLANGFYLRVVYDTSDDATWGSVTRTIGVTYDDVVANGPLTTSWQKFEGFITVPAGISWMRVNIYRWGGAGVGGTITIDDVSVMLQGLGFSNGDKSVYINADGITITEGKLILQDKFGTEVAGATGFVGPWDDFIRSGGYNCHFQYGNIAGFGPSYTGSEPNTTAAYLDSLSGPILGIPYWCIAPFTGSGQCEIVSDSGASYGRAMKLHGANTTDREVIFQDFPVVPGVPYEIILNMKMPSLPSSSFDGIYVSWRDADHGLIGSEVKLVEFDQVVIPTSYAFQGIDTDSSGTGIVTLPATANAQYIRVKIACSKNPVYVSDIIVHPAQNSFGSLEAREFNAPTIGTQALQWATNDFFEAAEDPGNEQISVQNGLLLFGNGINSGRAITYQDQSRNGRPHDIFRQSASVVLTTSYQDLPGLSCSILANSGQYFVIVVLDLNITGAMAASGLALGQVLIGSSPLQGQIIKRGDTIDRATVSQIYVLNNTASTMTLKVQAEKTLNSGSVTAQGTHAAMYVMPL